jgi:hypothetical protein
MTYVCPTWDFSGVTFLMNLQRLQNRVFRAIGKLNRPTPVRDLYLASKITYMYDYITKLCRRQAEVILNKKNSNIYTIAQGEGRHRNHKWFKLGGCLVCNRTNVSLPFLRVN